MFRSQVPTPVTGIEYWRYHSLEPGETINGWKAGHLIGANCHFFPQTVPCPKDFTNGELSCDIPHDKQAPRFHSWMPMIHEDGSKVVIGVRRNQFGDASAIEVGAPIQVKRGNRINMPVVVRWRDWCHSRRHPGADAAAPADLHRWLLRLWKMPELTEWVRMNPFDAGSPVCDSRDAVVPRPATTVEPPPSPEEVKKAKAILKTNLKAWAGDTSLNGSAHAVDLAPLDPIPKVIDVASLPADHPVRRRYAKGGVK